MTQGSIDKFIKTELRTEVINVMNEIEIRYKRVENYKGSSAARNDKTYDAIT